MCDLQQKPIVYEVRLVKESLKELDNLNSKIKTIFIKKLRKVINNPFIDKNKLSKELSHCYKIKLNREGYRLVYEIREEKIVLIVWAVGKRERSKAYADAAKRLQEISLEDCTVMQL